MMHAVHAWERVVRPVHVLPLRKRARALGFQRRSHATPCNLPSLSRQYKHLPPLWPFRPGPRRPRTPVCWLQLTTSDTPRHVSYLIFSMPNATKLAANTKRNKKFVQGPYPIFA